MKAWSKKAAPVLLAAMILAAPRPSARGADVTGHHVLSNGLEVRFLPSAATPLTGTLLLVKTGYALEGFSNLGYSHLLEHLVFAGTGEMSKEELFRRVEDMGAYLNGYTRDDYMGYIMVGHHDDFGRQMKLLSSILFRASMEEKALAEAREVVLEEIRRFRSRPDARVGEMFQALLYEGSPYARTGLGNERTVSTVSREEIVEHYGRVYRPDNMVLLVTGAFDASQDLEVLEETFGSAEPGAPPPPASLPPPLRSRRVHTLRTGIADQKIQIGFNGPDPRDGDAEVLELLGAVLGGRGGRLERALDAGGYSPRSADAFLAVNSGFSRFIVSAALPADRDGQGALGVILEEIAAAAGALAETEVEAARFALETSEVLGREKLHYYLMGKAPWFLAGAPGQGLSERRWEGITPSDLAAAAGRFLAGRPFVALISSPEGEEKEGGGAGELPRQRTVLTNGLVVMAEQRPGSRVFALNLLTRRRSEVEPEGRAGIADFLHRLLPLGTATLGREELEVRLRELGISLSTAGDPTLPFGDFYTSRLYSFLRLECLQEKAREAVRLAAEMTAAPSLSPAEVEKVRGQMKDFIAYRDGKPGSLAAALLAAGLYGPGGLGNDVLGDTSSVESITREDLLAFRERYFTGRNIILSVVSGLPPPEAVSLLAEHFTALPAGPEPPPHRLTATGESRVVTAELGKPQGALAAGAVIGPLSAPSREALAVVTGLLNDRLNRELREREGLAYSLGGSLGTVGNTVVFTFSMGTAAEKMEQARQGVRREIEGVRTMEVTPEELQRRVSAITGRLQMRTLSSLNRGFYLALAEREGLPHTFGEDYRERLLALDPGEVEAAAREYLPERVYEVQVR